MPRKLEITGQTPNAGLMFEGKAAVSDNIEGNPSTRRMYVVDEFWYDSQANYTVTLDGTNDAVAAIAGGVKGLSLLSGDTDNQVSYFATGLIFDVSNNPEIEGRFTLTDISQTSFFFGFSDAVTGTTPHSTIDYADATLAAASTDAVGFVSDADKESSLLYAAQIATGGAVAAQSSGVTPVENTEVVLRVKLVGTTATFYVNNNVVATKAAAVTDVPLCLMVNFGTRDGGGGDAIYMKRLQMWQD